MGFSTEGDSSMMLPESENLNFALKKEDFIRDEIDGTDRVG